MIALSPHVRYVLEPFRTSLDPCPCGVAFDYQFQYVTDENKDQFHPHLQHAMGLRFNASEALDAIEGPLDVLRVLRRYGSFLRARALTRVLVKDPIAVFSAEWLATMFDMQVIVMIRHPAGFVSSVKQLGWSHPFSDFIDQPLLMRDHLAPFEAEIRRYARRERSVIEQAILLWRLIYSVVHTYRERHDDWIFVRHEDLAREPLDGFEMLFGKLDLPLTKRVRDEIQRHSSPLNPTDPEDPYAIERDSRATIGRWKERLTSMEVERIKDRVSDLSVAFYSEEDW
jgi:hypothetical protein